MEVVPALDRPVQAEGETFFDETYEISTTNRDVVLAGSPDGLGEFYVDDEMTVSITPEGGLARSLTTTFLETGSCGSDLVFKEPVSLKPFLGRGKNTVRITMRDLCGGNEGATNVSLVGQGHFSRITDPPVLPASLKYFALGDSYASGEGAAPFDPDSNSQINQCHRSVDAGARIFGRAPGLPGRPPVQPFTTILLACSGAVMDDVAYVPASGKPSKLRQADLLLADTNLVSLSIGGNDIGFANIMKFCAAAPACDRGLAGQELARTVGDALLRLNRTDPATGLNYFDTVYQNIFAKAPAARLMVVGYPHLLGSGSAIGCEPFNKSERSTIDQIVDIGDTAIQLSATRNGAIFVDLRPYFAGHGACDADPFINRIRFQQQGVISKESFHPNPAGQRAIAAALVNAFSRGSRNTG